MSKHPKPDPELIDDENPEWTDAMFAGARPAEEVLGAEFIARARNKGGRPRKAAPKVSSTMRWDPDVLQHLKDTGPGWQTRLNAVVRGLIQARKL